MVSYILIFHLFIYSFARCQQYMDDVPHAGSTIVTLPNFKVIIPHHGDQVTGPITSSNNNYNNNNGLQQYGGGPIRHDNHKDLQQQDAIVGAPFSSRTGYLHHSKHGLKTKLIGGHYSLKNNPALLHGSSYFHSPKITHGGNFYHTKDHKYGGISYYHLDKFRAANPERERFAGSHLFFSAPRWRRSANPTRQKRALLQTISLIANPRAKLDVPATLENIGETLKSTINHQDNPSYHFRNAVGAARDALYSAMRIYPNDLFIPSSYKLLPVAKDSNDPLLGAVNADLYSGDSNNIATSDNPKVVVDNAHVVTTNHGLNGLLSQSAQCLRDIVNHANDVLYSTKNAVASVRKVPGSLLFSIAKAPKLVNPFDHQRLGSSQNPSNDALTHMIDLVLIPNQARNNPETTAISRNVDDPNCEEFIKQLKNAKETIGADSYEALIKQIKMILNWKIKTASIINHNHL